MYITFVIIIFSPHTYFFHFNFCCLIAFCHFTCLGWWPDHCQVQGERDQSHSPHQLPIVLQRQDVRDVHMRERWSLLITAISTPHHIIQHEFWQAWQERQAIRHLATKEPQQNHIQSPDLWAPASHCWPEPSALLWSDWAIYQHLACGRVTFPNK